MKKDTREIYKVLLKHGKKVLYSEEFVRAFHQKHHYRTSVAEHTLQVAAISVRLCRFLKRHGIAVDERAAVRGALMHDLGMVGRREKYKNDVECSQRHPIESAKVARRLYPDLDQKTVDIIERHMWPVKPYPLPTSVESIVVSLADKWGSITDLLPFAQPWEHRWAGTFVKE